MDESDADLITPEDGGKLKVDRGLRVEVEFPEGAVAAETEFTLRFLNSEELAFVVEPSDVPLLLPVEIKVDKLNKTDRDRFQTLALYRQDGKAWVPLPAGSDKGRNKIEGKSNALGVFTIGAGEGIGEAAEDTDWEEMAFYTESLDSIQLILWLSGPRHKTKFIKANKGGSIKLDRFEIDIPDDALSEDTYITLRDPGSLYLICDLEPHGITFMTPVTLEMNLKNLDIDGFNDWTIFWLNDFTGDWEDQGAVFDPDKEKVTANLEHFSRYGGGRAGW
jgi:hypothetical protein